MSSRKKQLYDNPKLLYQYCENLLTNLPFSEIILDKDFANDFMDIYFNIDNHQIGKIHIYISPGEEQINYDITYKK